MSLGSATRSLFGPFEPELCRRYRNLFTDLESFGRVLRAWTSAKEILEVGCGEGQATEVLARFYPDARITAIDPSPRVGRLYRGRQEGIRFVSTELAAFAASTSRRFDLIIICDVLHHVPRERHEALLEEIRSLLVPGGKLSLKDWEPTLSIPHLLNFLSDRFVTGDRVRYGRADYFRTLALRIFSGGVIEEEHRLPPWRNNFALLLQS